MTKTIKTPTFPIRAEIIEHINTTIRPEPGRIRQMQLLASEAFDLAAADSPGDSLGELVAAMIHDGATPTAKEFATAALDAERHAVIERACDRIEAASAKALVSLNNYPTSAQNDQILDYLSGVMDEIIAAARALPDKTPVSAEDAINYGDGGVELLKTVRQLVGAYTELRRAQRKACSISHIEMNATGHFKDATNTDAYWLKARRATVQENQAVFDRGAVPGIDEARTYFDGTPTTPWAPISGGAYPDNAKSTEDQARFIFWIARNAEPWVPSSSDLEQQHAKNTELTYLRTWIFPEQRRHIDDADIVKALASVKDRALATA